MVPARAAPKTDAHYRGHPTALSLPMLGRKVESGKWKVDSEWWKLKAETSEGINDPRQPSPWDAGTRTAARLWRKGERARDGPAEGGGAFAMCRLAPLRCRDVPSGRRPAPSA